jgi:hypothetical protein
MTSHMLMWFSDAGCLRDCGRPHRLFLDGGPLLGLYIFNEFPDPLGSQGIQYSRILL